MKELQEAIATFRSMPEAEAIYELLRERLEIPENYAELEQQGKLPEEHRESLIVYRAISQEAL
ncbi:hypothetical protein [Xenorhabdus innexi]|uniref:Uncharacterized protein n=1 Tax=Xenorhabdus innexi TaxID=290109 RepID=A0A1N6MWT8_9GAMM|nr:hypothetical protein [Xenorhabdus innexi]PHM35935.1 hypothetical protein Xinn_02005 [Xenorhabdus innexi]SIP73234.1 hypothetical protein XIS1_1790040 [Xenorhabdus innexi]